MQKMVPIQFNENWSPVCVKRAYDRYLLLYSSGAVNTRACSHNEGAALGFSVLLKDTSTHGLQGMEPPTFQSLDNHPSHSVQIHDLIYHMMSFGILFVAII